MESEILIQEFFEEHNPFMLKDEKGKLCYFECYADAYTDLLGRLKLDFPEGYIDLVVFLTEYYGYTADEAVSEVSSWERRGFKNPVLVDWSDPLYIEELRDVCQRMHFVSESSFKEDQFRLGFLKFTNNLKEGKYGKITRKDE